MRQPLRMYTGRRLLLVDPTPSIDAYVSGRCVRNAERCGCVLRAHAYTQSIWCPLGRMMRDTEQCLSYKYRVQPTLEPQPPSACLTRYALYLTTRRMSAATPTTNGSRAEKIHESACFPPAKRSGFCLSLFIVYLFISTPVHF